MRDMKTMAFLRRLAPVLALFPVVLPRPGFSGTAGAWELDREIADGSLWKADPVLLVKRHEEQGFRFTSSERDSADSRQRGAVVCCGCEAYETRMTFKDGAVRSVETSLFNRGGTESVVETKLDDGTLIRRRVRDEAKMSERDFQDLVDGLRRKLTPAKAREPKATDGELREKGTVAKECVWERSTLGAPVKLSWSYRQDGSRRETFEPGFIRLTIDAPSAGGKTKAGGKAEKSAKGAGKIADNVRRFPNGDVFLEGIPMVDQGMKGYCAAATCERVLKYYGVAVDEHEIAQAAGTSAEGGTSTKAMKDSVEKVGRRYKLAVDVRYGDFEKPVGERIAGLAKEVQTYNKTAKKLKKRQIAESDYIERTGNLVTYSPSAVDQAMEPEVLKEMRANGVGKARYVASMKMIKEQIGKGIPLFWGVKLGIYPEPEIPQAEGYHMRLIVGYNDRKREILYSDSWGSGHELKRMPADWAWTITKSLMFLRPLSR